MELAQDHMAHRQRQGGVSALLGVEPDVGELGRFGIVGADHCDLGPAIARLGHEMRIGRARLRHVRSPHQQKTRIVPVGTFGNIGLFAPGLRTGRRQVAIPVIERHAGAAEQRKIARSRSIGDHRHRRDGAEADDPVRPPFLRGIGVGRGNDLVHLIPARPHEAAMAADRGIGFAFGGILDDRSPCRDRGAHRARLAPQTQ